MRTNTNILSLSAQRQLSQTTRRTQSLLQGLSLRAAYNSSNGVKAQNLTLPEKVNEQSSTAPSGDSKASSHSRYIPKTIRHQIWARSEGQCEYRDALTQKRCESKFRLQFEHREPFAFGGKNNLENLAHYCQAHNQLAAIKIFGAPKVNEYISSL